MCHNTTRFTRFILYTAPVSILRACYTHRSLMRILDRYIVREIFRHAFLGLIVFTFVFFVPQLVRLMELFVRHTGSGSQILKLFLCIFPAVSGLVVSLLMTLWLSPLALRTFRSIEANLIASQISFQVQPRVFDERFPQLILYISDVAASGTLWHGVFLADTGAESGSRLTLAERAIVIPDPNHGTLQLHLQGGTTHEFYRDRPDRYSVTAFGQSDW